MRLRRTTAAALGLLVLAPFLAACAEDEGLATGDVLPARQDDQFAQGEPSFLMLPIGRLEVRLGEPVTTLRTNDTRELAAVDAPDGATFVPITWHYDAGTFMEHGDYLGDPPSPTIDLLSDGASYRVPAPSEEGEGSESFYLLVSGSADDVALRVEFDGVTQTVDLRTGDRDEGDAAGLYDIKQVRKGRRACPKPDLHGAPGVADLSCTVSAVTALPYAAGEWAEPGHTWLAFRVETQLRRFGMAGRIPGSAAAFYAESVDSRFTIRGEDPALQTRAGASMCPNHQDATCTDDHYLVFRTRKKARPDLRIDQRFRLKVLNTWRGYDGKKRLRLRATSVVPLR